MLKVAVIGYGAIARHVVAALPAHDASLSLVIARPGREAAVAAAFGPEVPVATGLGDARPDLLIDCAGHAGLREHGPDGLRAGVSLATVSLGALADPDLHDRLRAAALQGGAVLHLCTGAIGGLDALAAARMGHLEKVRYTGRKPPTGWAGSRAEDVLNLSASMTRAVSHFDGTAREAALLYPKNANVAAAVALAGIGFDATKVTLIADPAADANIHEIRASGDFGEMVFSISGNTLPGNPRTSALAAMSVVRTLADQTAWSRF